MSVDTQQIETIKSLSLTQLADLRVDPKPTYWIDGQRVHWEEYAESLQKTIDWCDKKINEDVAYEIRSKGGS